MEHRVQAGRAERVWKETRSSRTLRLCLILSSRDSLSVGEPVWFRDGEEPARYRDLENGGERGEFPPVLDWNDIIEFCCDM